MKSLNTCFDYLVLITIPLYFAKLGVVENFENSLGLAKLKGGTKIAGG